MYFVAEIKPPLFNMNAMSALYHIAQNDPPTLSTASNWTNDFVDFVNMCLTKDSSKRPSAAECSKVCAFCARMVYCAFCILRPVNSVANCTGIRTLPEVHLIVEINALATCQLS